MTQDKRGSAVVLTEGRESGGIIRFAIPLFIGNLFQQMYTVVDSIIIGQGVGKEAFAALGNSANILWLLNSLAIGLGMGTTIILSQYFGARDESKLKQTVDTGAVFQLVMAAVLSVAGAVLVGPILRSMKVPSEVYPYARLYLMIMILGMVFTFAYNAIGAVLRGIGDSRHPLYFLIIATVANIVLDILFVLVFKWGVAGAAAATLISQALSVAAGLWYIYRKSGHDFLHIRLRRLHLNRHVFGKTITVGLPFGGAAGAGGSGLCGIHPDRESLRHRHHRRIHGGEPPGGIRDLARHEFRHGHRHIHRAEPGGGERKPLSAGDFTTPCLHLGASPY